MQKTFLALLALGILSACDQPTPQTMCGDYTLLGHNDFMARIITPDDRYFTLHRTEAECGYRYSVMIDDSPVSLWDNCVGRWTLLVEEDEIFSCQ